MILFLSIAMLMIAHQRELVDISSRISSSLDWRHAPQTFRLQYQHVHQQQDLPRHA